MGVYGAAAAGVEGGEEVAVGAQEVPGGVEAAAGQALVAVVVAEDDVVGQAVPQAQFTAGEGGGPGRGVEDFVTVVLAAATEVIPLDDEDHISCVGDLGLQEVVVEEEFIGLGDIVVEQFPLPQVDAEVADALLGLGDEQQQFGLVLAAVDLLLLGHVRQGVELNQGDAVLEVARRVVAIELQVVAPPVAEEVEEGEARSVRVGHLLENADVAAAELEFLLPVLVHVAAVAGQEVLGVAILEEQDVAAEFTDQAVLGIGSQGDFLAYRKNLGGDAGAEKTEEQQQEKAHDRSVCPV